MADKRSIRGDIDKVYDNTNSNSECVNITAYLYSKGDIKTNSVSNKFCNIEILKGLDSLKGLFYLAITSGRLGSTDNNIVVRRFNSDTIVRQCYLDECKKREQEGYNKVEVVSIYPNCSGSAKEFVSKKNILSKDKAKEVVEEKKDKLGAIVKVAPLAVDNFKLNSKVEEFVNTIYYEANVSIHSSINPQAFQSNDASRPLGMINLNMINQGRKILKEISDNLNKFLGAKQNSDKYVEVICNLSNMYNSTIPRVFKRGKDNREWLLDTGEKLMEQYDLLDILEYALSSAVLNTKGDTSLQTKYTGLNSDISLVTDKKLLLSIVEKMKKEQLASHHFNTKLVNVFEVNQKNAPNFDNSVGGVASLFHGTKGCNLYGILSSHIKLPTNLGSNVQITGAMFGPGVYFGEYSKSLQYATSRFSTQKNKSRKYFLFLCDVALGKVKMEPHGVNYAKSPNGFNSVMGVGGVAFKSGCEIMGIGGTSDFVIPTNAFHKTLGRSSSSLLYNEFIVYNQNRYKIRYIVEVEEAK